MRQNIKRWVDFNEGNVGVPFGDHRPDDVEVMGDLALSHEEASSVIPNRGFVTHYSPTFTSLQVFLLSVK